MQYGAFWGSQHFHFFILGVISQTSPFSGLGIGISSLNVKANNLKVAHLLTNHSSVQTLRSYDIRHSHIVGASRAFLVAAPTVWNSLPRRVTNCSTFHIFGQFTFISDAG
jgi:hypothetical protein